MVAVLYLTGCSKLDLGGGPKENIRPKVYFTNIPTDSILFSYNPAISWYGIDEDGIIEEYYYKLVLKYNPEDSSQVVNPGAFVDSVTIPPDSSWTAVESSGDVVKLYAPEDTLLSYEQYIFVMAKDDDGAFSLIKYRLFARINHPPDTHLITDFWRTFYSYPYLTEYFKGLTVEWIGSDSSDFPDAQPSFEYHWALFGPYATPEEINASTLDSNDVYTALDSTSNKMVRWESLDTLSGGVWVTEETVTLYNLRTGYYFFWVMARDDAFVVDSSFVALDSLGNPTNDTTSAGIIHVMQPYWNSGSSELKDILIIDDSGYQNNAPGVFTDSATYRAFYREILDSCGVPASKVDWYDNHQGTDTGGANPDDLVKYKMLLILNDDWTKELGDSALVWYSRYLDVTGQIMVTGRYTFRDVARGENYPTYVIYGSDATGQTIEGDNIPGRFARDYLNLYGSHFPGWQFQTNLNQEMVGAYGAHADFSDIDFDSTKVVLVSHRGSGYWYGWGPDDSTPEPDDSIMATTNYYLPAVEYLERQNQSETLLKFRSYQPYVSAFDGWPVAVRYEASMEVGTENRTAFKTSYFSFPLFYVEKSQAIQVMQAMLQWYGII